MIHGFSAQDIVLVIAAVSAAGVALLTAWRNGAKIAAVDAKVSTTSGAPIGEQVADLTTSTALATEPALRTEAQTAHLDVTTPKPLP